MKHSQPIAKLLLLLLPVLPVFLGVDACHDPTIYNNIDDLSALFEEESRLYGELDNVRVTSTQTNNQQWLPLAEAFVEWSDHLKVLSEKSEELVRNYNALSIERKHGYKARILALEPLYENFFRRPIRWTLPYEPWTYRITWENSFAIQRAEAMRPHFGVLYNRANDTPSLNWSINMVQDSNPSGLATAVRNAWKARPALLICTGSSSLACGLKSQIATYFSSHLNRQLQIQNDDWIFSETFQPNLIFEKLTPNPADPYLVYGEPVAIRVADTQQYLFASETAPGDFTVSTQTLVGGGVWPWQWELHPIWERNSNRTVQAVVGFGLYNRVTQMYLVDCPRSAKTIAWYQGSLDSRNMTDLYQCQ
ncbi:MAG TPA: hypothetical protein PLH57_01815 [Oligoflexia bacterium]|nr:hypothetical protein [Oligoflexia bacterium]